MNSAPQKANLCQDLGVREQVRLPGTGGLTPKECTDHARAPLESVRGNLIVALSSATLRADLGVFPSVCDKRPLTPENHPFVERRLRL